MDYLRALAERLQHQRQRQAERRHTAWLAGLLATELVLFFVLGLAVHQLIH